MSDVAGSPMRAGNGSADGAGCAADAPGYALLTEDSMHDTAERHPDDFTRVLLPAGDAPGKEGT